MTSESTTGRKEGRIARHIRVAREIRHEPRTVVVLVRGWLLSLWQAKGGGFYGLGYVIAFVTMEIQALAGSIAGSSVSGFVLQQAFEYVTRICIQSFLNAFLALLWPALLLQWLGLWGIAVLVAGYFGFERGLRPLLETWFPELREARMRKAERKQEKAARKRARRA